MTRWLPLFALLLLAGCRPGFNLGGACTLNSDCVDPLVCGLGLCRRQCVDSRDCAAGLLCLQIGDSGLCQLSQEAMCTLTSECTQGLVCRFGTCTTECMNDRDCPSGATCSFDESEHAYACHEAIANECVYNSDCGPPFVCGPDQQCRYECVGDQDCDPLRYCDTTMHRCFPRADAGP